MAQLDIALALGLVELIDLDPEVPQYIEARRGIVYRRGEDYALELDVYRKNDSVSGAEATPASAPGPALAPALVFIHGGSWRSGDRNDYLPYLIDYAGKGFVTVTISYRFQQQAKFPAAVTDVFCALSYISEHAEELGIDRQRIGLVGGSAGAHLALMAAYTQSDDRFSCDDSLPRDYLIRCVVDLYGPVDMRTDFGREHPIVRDFLGTTFAQHPELYDAASPITYVTGNSPPTLIFHGTLDTTLPVNQSDLLASALSSAGVPYEYHRLPGWPHAMDVARPVNEYCRFYMDEFFAKYLEIP